MSASGAPPPPPPPPAPPLLIGYSSDVVTENSKASDYFERCNCTDFYKEIEENLNSILELPGNEDKMALCTFSFVQPILQRGPVCGIVALGMALDHFSQADTSMEAIFAEAKNSGMTKSGEMFSANKMQELVEWSISSSEPEIHCRPELVNTENPETMNKVLTCLLQNDLILIPYDADYNHAPALRNGIAAHWALIIGLAMIVNKEQTAKIFPKDKDELAVTDETKDKIIFIEKLPFEQKSKLLEFITQIPSMSSKIYLLCRQGKSKHIGTWAYPHLIHSNQNLKDIGNKIRENSDKYILESIDITLRSQAILLWRENIIK